MTQEFVAAYKPPFPWFGGKSRAAKIVWDRFGNVPNYVEPFAGSLAVMMLRPHEPKTETINDLDCYVANFWRALSVAPDDLYRYADWPVNEADLHARHLWLVNQTDFREKMKTEPDYFDAKIAGWWVWGICQWIGHGWCDVSQQLPHLLSNGMGIHRPSQQLPHLGNNGRERQDLFYYFESLAKRLRNVRVCCGDWSRVLGPTPTEKNGLTGVFLDPPYSDQSRAGVYSVDDYDVAHSVREWAIANGNNPMLRIALCGYDSEHSEIMPDDWTVANWQTHGGYSNQSKNGDNGNKYRERIWFSPHCLQTKRYEQSNFLV